MPLTPAVGQPGGQWYDVARAIRTFLEQMAGGGGFSFGGAVIKELIQNADDAGATELVVALDERNGEDVPRDCTDYAPLFEPALLIRNDARFRLRARSGKANRLTSWPSARSPPVTSASTPQPRADSE